MLNIDESYQHVVQDEIQEYHWSKRKNIPFAVSKNILACCQPKKY